MSVKFCDFKISEDIISSLMEMGFEEPTPIQQIAIPPALKGTDIIGQAQTGTGKTAAFGIPMIEGLLPGTYPSAMVLAPTRELAIQIAQELNRIGRKKRILSVPIYGGQSIERQIRALKKGVNIVVGTPGRIIDHIHRKTLNLKNIKILVLDEADEMLNMGFIDDIERIINSLPQDKQTMLFSATMPAPILKIARKYMKSPERVSVDSQKLVVSSIRQVFYEVREEDKIKALSRIIDVEDPALALVFCHTKKEVDEVAGKLQQMGYYAGAIHGDYAQVRRERIMDKFRNGDIDILVATDVAARGLDVTDVSHVINFSIPQNPDSYVHRIGRTGRAGKSGIAITFVTPREYRNLRQIERTAKTRILKAELPSRDEVIKVRQKEIIDEIEYALNNRGFEDKLSIVEHLCKRFSLKDIAASALQIAFSYAGVEDIEDISHKLLNSRDDYTRLFISIGKKDGISPSDIIRMLSRAADIDARKIGNISILEKFSFVEVQSSIADMIIKKLKNSLINGKRVFIDRAKEKQF